jgi:hypothetical protein
MFHRKSDFLLAIRNPAAPDSGIKLRDQHFDKKIGCERQGVGTLKIIVFVLYGFNKIDLRVEFWK